LSICLGISIYGYFWLATAIEVKYYLLVALGFIWLGIGFGFYQTKYPECIHKSSWI
jgi:hypothetical protein